MWKVLRAMSDQNSMNKGLLITLSGLDGAGKSTLARIISTRLEQERGLTSKAVWCKFGIHPLSSLRLRQTVGPHTPKTATHVRFHPRKATGAFAAYGRILLWLHYAQLYWQVLRSLRKGHAVVCDRYLYDTIIDLQQEFSYGIQRAIKASWQSWLPRPDHAFLLDLRAEKAFERQPDSVSIAFLEDRGQKYAELVARFGLIRLDATQPPDVLADQIIRRIDHTKRDEERYVLDG